ncbi:MAG: ATP phosphoribosyltransferase [Dehalococcoidales bacterium]|nr:ATP phosphoribosyltransferase [Dehalococcoidales bacterium]
MKIALPKGRLLPETADLLQRANWGLIDYRETTRRYYMKSAKFPDLSARLFHEKDIPIQVAVGNYDLGICGLDWVEELLVKYPSSALVKIKNLGYNKGALYMAASQLEGVSTLEEMQARHDVIRIAGEYPNLAESFAVNMRLRRFNIFPLWGAAEVYPPEGAELVLVPSKTEGELANYGLTPVSRVLSFSAFLVANKLSWEAKDMDGVLTSIGDNLVAGKKHPSRGAPVSKPEMPGQHIPRGTAEDAVHLALPDGHQQLPTIQLLNKAGIQVHDYPSEGENRRPTTNLAGVAIKVIRPQDMPLQVANGNFDLAITGRDWLNEHRYQFPSSPVTELLDLKQGRVKIVAVVSKDLSVADVDGLRRFSAERSGPLRLASEYVNIADKYARDNHLGMYQVIPTWGDSEAFLPGDADLLIENTETGRTIARHNLKIIDTLFVSTACLIGRKNSVVSPAKSKRIKHITELLRTAVEDTQG